MPITDGFQFEPLDSPRTEKKPAEPELGPLEQLTGVWKGKGFNAIWRPSPSSPGHFLELNATDETLKFERIPGNIPNRGLLQPDILMFGVRYLQEISDANQGGAGLHLEPGLWLSVPATTDPAVQPSVARLASIPHGTTVVAQGLGFPVHGGPRIDRVSLDPFPIGHPDRAFRFPEQNLSAPTRARTPDKFLTGITQAIVDNPNSLLLDAIKNKKQTITETVVLDVTTLPTPIIGGGTANTAFLKGGPHGPNADATQVTSTFWIEKVQGSDRLQLQYTQNVLLDFNGLSWPHVTVATLTKEPPAKQ